MKLPGEKTLKENAERRRNKAALSEIETHLKRIHQTTDLGYSQSTLGPGEEDESTVGASLID